MSRVRTQDKMQKVERGGNLIFLPILLFNLSLAAGTVVGSFVLL